MESRVEIEDADGDVLYVTPSSHSTFSGATLHVLAGTEGVYLGHVDATRLRDWLTAWLIEQGVEGGPDSASESESESEDDDYEHALAKKAVRFALDGDHAEARACLRVIAGLQTLGFMPGE